MFQTKVVGKIKTHILYSVTFFFFFRNHAVNGIMGKNTVEPDRQQMAVWHMHIECWILQATQIPLEHITLIALPLQQCLHEHTSLLGFTYIFCFVYILF